MEGHNVSIHLGKVHPLLILFPLIAFSSLFLVLGNLGISDWRRAFLRASILSGLYLVVITEMLSLMGAITALALSLAWLFPTLCCIAWLVHSWRSRGALRLPRWRFPSGRLERVFLSITIVIVIVTGILAWISPPATWDSLNYHLPRVAHWAQQKAVRFYVTGIEVQNSMPPGAEMAILHTYVLVGSDRLANFISWFCMLGSLIGVSLVVRQLGGGSVGQSLAALFTATLPMGIVQASSTMTDYVVAIWMVTLASESVSILENKDLTYSTLFASISAGLGLITKQTSLAYITPFAVVVAITLVRRWPLRRFIGFSIISIALVLFINLGHLARTFELFGNPIASRGRMTAHLNEIFDFRVLVSNTLRNASLHAGTPSPHINKGIHLVIQKIHDLMGLAIDDPRTTIGTRFKLFIPNTEEVLTTNPAHAWVILVLLITILIRRRKVASTALTYTLAVVAGFLLLSWLLQWEIFNGRLHLSFFVLCAPLVAYQMGAFTPTKWITVVAAILCLTSIPWLVGIRSRPLIQNSRSYVGSVFLTPRTDLLFANGGHLKQPHLEMTSMILQSGCRDVGILLPGNDAEYPLWVLLGAPLNAPRIEWIDSGITSRYTDPKFEPCAVMCRRCPGDGLTYRHLKLAYKHTPTDFRLFLDPALPSGE